MITIPKQLYVGLRGQEDQKNSTPLGFVIPYGTDKAYEKRKTTVDNWVEGYYPRQKKLTKHKPLVVDNSPHTGYEISNEVRRTGWGGGNVVWRMVDPRGFEFEISSQNLASILDCSAIEKGVIKAECVFGRDGARNVLLPTTSEPYQAAFANTVRVAKKVSVKDISVGDRIVLKDGTSGLYLGQKKVVCCTSNSKYNYPRYIHDIKSVDLKSRHMVLTFAVPDDEKDSYTNEGRFPYCSRKGRFYKEGEMIVTAYSDLHATDVLETKVDIDASAFKVLPDNMLEAYGILDHTTKITDLKVVLNPISLSAWQKTNKHLSRRPMLLACDRAVPVMLNETQRYVRGESVTGFIEYQFLSEIRSIENLVESLMGKIEYFTSSMTSDSDPIIPSDRVSERKLFAPYLQLKDKTEILIK